MTVTKPTATAERAPVKGLLASLLGFFRPRGGRSRKADTANEEAPIKVHSRWGLTQTVFWVDPDELFRRKKTKMMLKILKEMYERDRPHHSAANPGPAANSGSAANPD